MPALTMRGRYLMREYWADSELHTRLSAEQRELYIALWMLADDGGWLPRNVTEIAAAVYQFEDRGPREAKVRSGLSRLGDMGKVKSLRCGHLFVPAVLTYPRAGRKSTEHTEAHAHCGSRIQRSLVSEAPNTNGHSYGDKDIQTDLNSSPVPSLPDAVPSSTGAHTREGNDVSDFRRLVGPPEVVLGGRKH